MSSEMRMHDDEGRCLCGCTENCAVAAELRGEITRLRAVVNRMVEEDNERFASEALLARTEAGADRPVAEISELSGAKLIVLYSADEIGHLPKGTKLYTRPQDASGDAERICDYLCEQEYDIGGRDELLAHIRAAMQAKEAK